MKYADNSIVSNPGSGIQDVYGPVVDKDGNIKIVKTGEEDLHAYIQSQKDMTDMSYIISRMAAGDSSVIRSDGQYGDFSVVPNSLADVLQLQLDSHRLFDSLPVAVKEQFDFDPNRFFAQSGTEDWYEKISPVLPDDMKKVLNPAKENVESEVKVGE